MFRLYINICQNFTKGGFQCIPFLSEIKKSRKNSLLLKKPVVVISLLTRLVSSSQCVSGETLTIGSLFLQIKLFIFRK